MPIKSVQHLCADIQGNEHRIAYVTVRFKDADFQDYFGDGVTPDGSLPEDKYSVPAADFLPLEATAEAWYEFKDQNGNQIAAIWKKRTIGGQTIHTKYAWASSALFGKTKAAHLAAAATVKLPYP